MNFPNKLRMFFLGLILTGLAISLLSSCRTGYGCKGNQSWKQMERRINRPY